MGSADEAKSANVANNDVDVEVQVGQTLDATVGTKPDGFPGRLRTFIKTIGAEEHGIERIPEDLRTNQPPRDLATLFLSANFNTATLALGYLGPTLYGLGWWDSFLAVLFFNVVGGLFPAVAAAFGPKLGLRTMVIPRYSFGWWGAKIPAVLNVINQIGWGIVNGISGAAVLYDAGGGHLPLTVAVLIVGLVAITMGIFGYRVVHIYDRYSWYVMVVCMIFVAGFGARHFVNVPMGMGPVEASNLLSFGTTIIGFQAAWLPVAADYGVYMRPEIRARSSFTWAYAGLLSSQLLVELLGVALGTLSQSSNPLFQDAYTDRGIGGLIGAVFQQNGPHALAFGRFIEVLLGFSTAAVITTNIYSLGLSVQMISVKLLVIPRLVWTLIGSAVFLACAIAGRDHLVEVMDNFLLICAYWIVPFLTIFLAEHFVWRRDFDYDPTAWNDRTKLPYGFAATFTWFVCTAISVLCMSQTWWVGPIAAGIGGSEAGTDISWILALVVGVILYIPLRMWERKIWHL